MTENVIRFPTLVERDARLKARSLHQLTPLMPAILNAIEPMLVAMAAEHCVVSVRPPIREAVAQFAATHTPFPECQDVYDEILDGGPALGV